MIQQASNTEDSKNKENLPYFLSTHSSSEERIEIIQSTAIDYELEREGTTLLDPNFGIDWPAVQEELRKEGEINNKTTE